MQQRRLSAILTQQSYPLASRPLLVPVSYTIDKASYALIERMLPMLAEAGVQCDFVSESRLLVRTIPQMLPSVDIQSFLLALNQEPSTLPELLTLLIACQTCDARQLSNDEQIELMAYMQATPDALVKSGLRMDVATCRGLLHD